MLMKNLINVVKIEFLLENYAQNLVDFNAKIFKKIILVLVFNSRIILLHVIG